MYSTVRNMHEPTLLWRLQQLSRLEERLPQVRSSMFPGAVVQPQAQGIPIFRGLSGLTKLSLARGTLLLLLRVIMMTKRTPQARAERNGLPEGHCGSQQQLPRGIPGSSRPLAGRVMAM